MQATIPMGRLGLAEECAGAFLYLVSDQMSGYVTGQIIEVNGGVHAVTSCSDGYDATTRSLGWRPPVPDAARAPGRARRKSRERLSKPPM